MTRALETLMIARVVNGTAQVRTLLTVCVIRTVSGANQDRRIAFSRIVKIQTRVRRECLSTLDRRRRKRFRFPRVNGRLRRKPCCADKQRRRRQSQEIAKLAASYVRLLVALVRKISLIRRRRNAYVRFV